MSIPTKTLNPCPVILLFGPTAVGKTELLESILPGQIEVINTDSMQVYRGMDIGTAKPDPDFLKKVKHHLIDILDPDESFNAGEYVKRADQLVKEISGRNHIPVLCGGTAFYFKNFMYGLPETPAVPKEIKHSVLVDFENEGLPTLYSELKMKDPSYAATIPSTQKSRIIRALEVIRYSGKPLSSFKGNYLFREQYKFLSIGLKRKRNELYERIDRRVDIMFDDGLENEVKYLLEQGYTGNDPGMKGIGYKEFFQWKLQGCLNRMDLKDIIRRNSRRYAKRQITFFSSINNVIWLSPDHHDEIMEVIDGFLN